MPTEPEAPVAAAILTWNGAHLLEMVLGSLERQDFRDFTTIVVDNGSTDGTVELVRERWPWARVVALPDNVGITAGLNKCVEAASGSEFVALLNNDVELEPRWLSELVAALRAEPTAASASGKVLRYDRPHLIDSAGDEMAWSGAAIGRGAGEVDRGQYDAPGRVFGACGGVGLFRMGAFDDVGPFDEQFEAYHEDSDWAFRAQLAGWTSVYTPAAIARHVGGASSGHDSDFALFHGMRNAIWLIVKNYPASSLLRHAPELLRRHTLLVVYNARGGRLRLLARAWVAAMRGLPAVMAKRRQVQRHATVGAAALEPVLVHDGRRRAHVPTPPRRER